MECNFSSVNGPVQIDRMLEVNKLSADTIDLITEVDINDPETLGDLTQSEINLAAIKIKKYNPAEFDAYLEVLAKQSASVTIPVDQYIAALEPAEPIKTVDVSVNENNLPRIKETVVLSESGNDKETLTILVKPVSVGVVHYGVISDTSSQTRYVILLEDQKYHNGEVDSQRYLIAGPGQKDLTFEQQIDRTIRIAYNISPLGDARFDTKEAGEIIELIKRAEESCKKDPNKAPLIANLQKVATFIQQQIEGK